MASVIRCRQGELFQGRKVTFDSVQPRRIRWRAVEANLVRRRPHSHLGLEMRTVVVGDDVEHLLRRVTSADPLQESEELDPRFVGRELAIQPIGLQIVDRQKVSHAECSFVGSAQAPRVAIVGVAVAMTRLQVQRTELVDAQATPIGGSMAVKTPNGPVFPPEFGIGRLFPGLGSAQANPHAVEQLPQPLNADVTHDLLLDEVSPQLGERPLVHADQLLGRRQCHLGDLLANIGEKPACVVACLPYRKPENAEDALGVEPVDDRTHPLRRATDADSDFPIPDFAARQEDDTGMEPVDRIAMLSFHALQARLFVRAQRPYDNGIHDGSPWARTFAPLRRPLSIKAARSCLTSEHYSWRESDQLEAALAEEPMTISRPRNTLLYSAVFGSVLFGIVVYGQSGKRPGDHPMN